ncbi:MAG: hypothetical protein KAS12_01630 [Candidatus Aenigmarchaeota archaeon]|nr:hypothetical protein [Candidatus Aenigmarchaeota archaeon]
MDFLTNETFLKLIEEQNELEIGKVENDYYNICNICNIVMNYNPTDGYCCGVCGLVRGSIGEHRLDHNDSVNVVQYMKVVGQNSSKYQKLLYGCMISNYTESRRRVILDEYKKKNMDNGNILPADVIDAAAAGFNKIAETRVLRADVRRATMAACLADACSIAHINRRPKEIAKFMGLQRSGFATGEGILRKYQSDEQIDTTGNIDPTDDYLRRYFESLKLDLHYIPFVAELIAIADNKNIGVHSIASTKCAGGIYILIMAKKLQITTQQIDIKCDIRKNTFNKFFDEVVARLDIFRDVFIKYNIPMDIKSRKRNKKINVAR